MNVPGIIYSVTSFPGATIRGLSNDKSVTSHGETICHISQLPNIKHIGLLFGAVDLDFTYIYKLARDPTLVLLEYYKDSINSYIKLIYKILESNATVTIHILSVQLSPLTDEHYLACPEIVNHTDQSIVSDLLSKHELSHHKRNTNTILFNDMLETAIRDQIKNARCIFHRIDKDMYCNETGILHEMHINGKDHHPKNTINLWRSLLKPYFPFM